MVMCDIEFKKGRFKLRIKLNHINVGVYVSFKVDSLPLEHILRPSCLKPLSVAMIFRSNNSVKKTAKSWI